MRAPVIVDTNVYIVANGASPQASPACVAASVSVLEDVRAHGLVLLDSNRDILEEYINYLHVSGQPGVGDRFFKWLWDNQGHEELCRFIDITPVDEPRMYLEFPADERLDGFDRSDRKFVAVALASGANPKIVNAVDSDWWIFGALLREYALNISNICPDAMP